MSWQEIQLKQDIRSKCLFRAFADITNNFADWYQATQHEIEFWEDEVSRNLLPGNL